MSNGPCLADTNTIDLVFDGTNLSGNLKMDPASGLTSTAGGTKINLPSSSGLEIVSNQLRIDVQGGGLARGAAGLTAVNQATSAGWNVGESPGLVAVNTNVAKGATVQVGSTVSLNISNLSDISSRFMVFSSFGVDFETTFTELDPASNFLDAVYVSLERNVNGGGWGEADNAGLLSSRQYQRVMLHAIDNIGIAGPSTSSYAIRLVSIGGTAGSSAIQGHIKNIFNVGILVQW